VTALIVDTGPLVALLNARDQHHAWARATFATFAPPLVTCEAVVSEACFLVRRFPGGPEAVLALVERGVLEVTFRLAGELPAVAKLMKRYASVPMSLADACLVRMAELDSKARIVTCDTDFAIFRSHGKRALSLIAPFLAASRP
jgi:predicted nucleic acid-binding protein